MSHHIPDEEELQVDQRLASEKIKRDVQEFLDASDKNQIEVIPFGVSSRSGKGNEYYRAAKAT